MTDADQLITGLWRQALALTGERESAEWVVAAAIGACDNPLKLRADRRDRLITQWARESERRRTEPAGSPANLGLAPEGAQLWTASRALPRLQLEAWTLRVLEGMEEIRAARALDCSRTAMNAALDEAEERLRRLMGEGYVTAIDTIRRGLAEADASAVAPAIAERTRRARSRRRVISIVQFVLFAACAGVLIWVGWDLIRSDETEDPLRGLREQYSVPMPASPPAQPAPEPVR